MIPPEDSDSKSLFWRSSGSYNHLEVQYCYWIHNEGMFIQWSKLPFIYYLNWTIKHLISTYFTFHLEQIYFYVKLFDNYFSFMIMNLPISLDIEQSCALDTTLTAPFYLLNLYKWIFSFMIPNYLTIFQQSFRHFN